MTRSHTALYSDQESAISQTLPGRIIAKLRRDIYDPFTKKIFEILTSNKSLVILDKKIHYFSHWYNFTWTNERAIEIPYFQKILQDFQNENILEIGNTLSHYQQISHTVIDKYEHASGVLSIDVMDYKPKKKYDLILAISTFEHIGWHEASKDKTKALKAIRYLQSLLSPSGKLVFSIPFGVNPGLDQAIKDYSLPYSKHCFLRRVNFWNLWESTSYEQVKEVRYNSPYPNANAILIAEVLPKKK